MFAGIRSYSNVFIRFCNVDNVFLDYVNVRTLINNVLCMSIEINTPDHAIFIGSSVQFFVLLVRGKANSRPSMVY